MQDKVHKLLLQISHLYTLFFYRYGSAAYKASSYAIFSSAVYIAMYYYLSLIHISVKTLIITILVGIDISMLSLPHTWLVVVRDFLLNGRFLAIDHSKYWPDYL